MGKAQTDASKNAEGLLEIGRARVCRIPYVAEGPWIDGNLDDAAWERALCLDGMLDITPHLDYRYDVAASKAAGFGPEPQLGPASPKTRVLLCHDGTHLYAGFRCEDPNVAEIRKRDHGFCTPEVQHEDCVFLWADGELSHLVPYISGYVVNAAGQMSERSLPFRHETQPDKYGRYAFILGLDAHNSKAAWQGRVRIQKDGWTAELFVPIDRLGSLAAEKRVFGLNLGRGYRGCRQRHALFAPDGDVAVGWGTAVLLDEKNEVPAGSVEALKHALAGIERQESGRALRTDPGRHRDSNAMVGISVWGPDHQPTISVGRSDCYDRRWYGNDGPVVTRQDVIDAAMSGDTECLVQLHWRSALLHYPAYDHFPGPKPVGQAIFGLPGGAEAGWVTDVAGGEDGAIRLDCRCDAGRIGLNIYVHKRRNVVVIEGTQEGLGGQEIFLRLYRNNDAPRVKGKLPFYDYEADEQSGKDFGPLPPVEAGLSNDTPWIRQAFRPDLTFPDGFDVLMAAGVSGADVIARKSHHNETGLGTPAKSPMEGWVDPVSGQAWAATNYERLNALPGSGVTIRLRLTGPSFRVLLPVLSRAEAADTLAAAACLLQETMPVSPETLEADSRSATPSERIGTYGYKQDLALSSIGSAKFCFSDVTAWHGDFHFNEWTQKFYDYFIEGRTDVLESYFQMVEENLPAARALAKEAFGCRGAAWGVASFPMKLKRLPMTNISWDYSMECTGMVFQPFWLTYLYTMDETFLRDRGYPAIREAALFYADYATLEDDGLYHIWPCTSSENGTLQPYLRHNRDTQGALTMMKYILKAAIEAADKLGKDADLVATWRDMVERLAPYPVEETPDGPRLVDAADGRLLADYNIAAPLFAVIYGNDIGLASPEAEIAKAERTIKGIVRISTPQHNTHLYRAMTRLGMYPGTRIGYENLIQSHQGPIFLFPAVPEGYTGEFKDYRATGAFSVSAAMRDGNIERAAIRSLAGRKCVVSVSNLGACPKAHRTRDGEAVKTSMESGRFLSFETNRDETYELRIGK